MENDYKDVLIKLLLEKLQQKEQPLYLTAAATTMRKKRTSKTTHHWTRQDKMQALQMDAEGIDVKLIAQKLDLRRAQVENMIYALKNGRSSI